MLSDDLLSLFLERSFRMAAPIRISKSPIRYRFKVNLAYLSSGSWLQLSAIELHKLQTYDSGFAANVIFTCAKPEHIQTRIVKFLKDL